MTGETTAGTNGAQFLVATRPVVLGKVRVDVEGEVDLVTSGILDAEFDRVLERRTEHIVVDLQKVTFCSCAGLGTLVRLHNTCRAAGIDLCLVPSGHVRRIMDLVELSREMPLRTA